MAGQVGIWPRSTVTPMVLEMAVWAGSNLGSYGVAQEGLQHLARVEMSAKRIRGLTIMIGQLRVAEREEMVEWLRQMPIPQRQMGSRAARPPALAVICMDGGRYQRRDGFGQSPGDGLGCSHWRETKVGCLLSMESMEYADDPAPEFPQWLASRQMERVLAELCGQGMSGAGAEAVAEAVGEVRVGERQTGYEPPVVLSGEVLASGAEAEDFGWQLEARAWQLGFPAAARQAFVADGAAVTWAIQQRHFPQAVPIVDLLHALSYAWSAAVAVGKRRVYRQWAEWIWQGKVGEVIAVLADYQQQLGQPPPQAPPSDPRQQVHRALTYYRNNQRRMDYPRYRREGLPLTSSHIESTVKLINHRVKGTEKFWEREAGEAVLQLRADWLSDSKPLDRFWHRLQAQQTGSNHYRTAS